MAQVQQEGLRRPFLTLKDILSVHQHRDRYEVAQLLTSYFAHLSVSLPPSDHRARLFTAFSCPTGRDGAKEHLASILIQPNETGYTVITNEGLDTAGPLLVLSKLRPQADRLTLVTTDALNEQIAHFQSTHPTETPPNIQPPTSFTLIEALDHSTQPHCLVAYRLATGTLECNVIVDNSASLPTLAEAIELIQSHTTQIVFNPSIPGLF